MERGRGQERGVRGDGPGNRGVGERGGEKGQGERQWKGQEISSIVVY